jgi:hypothetical protein
MVANESDSAETWVRIHRSSKCCQKSVTKNCFLLLTGDSVLRPEQELREGDAGVGDALLQQRGLREVGGREGLLPTPSSRRHRQAQTQIQIM